MSIQIIKHEAGLYTLYAKQTVDKEIDFLWDFFSKPRNLNKLTPEDVQFKIISGKSDDFYEGKIISYKIKPFKLVALNWVTEISQVKEGSYFIDNQIFGPYKMWHHEHIFEKIDDNNCKIIDKVSYKLPLGLIGRWSHNLLIKKQLQTIFDYRTKIINTQFL